MRRSQRLITAGGLFAALHRARRLRWRRHEQPGDPTDMLDFLDTKKKLPGQPPAGVLRRRARARAGRAEGPHKGGRREIRSQEDQMNGVAPATARGWRLRRVRSAPPPKPRARRQGTRPSQAAPAEPDAAPAGQGAGQQDEAPPRDPASRPSPSASTAAPPVPPPDQAQPQQQPAAPAQQSQSAFPAPLPSGSFSR